MYVSSLQIALNERIKATDFPLKCRAMYYFAKGGIFGPLLANTFTGSTLYVVLAVLYFIAFTAMEMNVRK